MEDQLRIAAALGRTADVVRELEALDERNMRFDQEVVGALLHLLTDDFAATLLDDVIASAVCKLSSRQLAEIHGLADAWLGVQESSLT